MHTTFNITKIQTENYRTKTLHFDQALSDAHPGQYVMAWLPGVGEKPFSIAGREPLTLMVVAVGPFSEALHHLNVGDRVWVRGPLGQGYTVHGHHLLLVGGGYGVAPLWFLAREALAAGCTVDVCLGARTARDVLLAETFTQAQLSPRITTEDGTLGTQGLVTQAVTAAIATRRPDCVYACGPLPMLTTLARQCRTHTLPHQLSWEAHIRCGMGICGACELDTKTRQATNVPAGWLVCKDGPVWKS